MGAKGKWIRGDVSWNTLSYLSYRRECNEAHVEWMQEFLASHTAQANRQHAGTGLWLGLNTYAGKNLWSLLAQARKIGVALVHSRGPEPVRLVEQPAAVGLNLTRFGPAPVPGRGERPPSAPPAGTTAGCRSRPPSPSRARWLIRPSVGTIGRPGPRDLPDLRGGRAARSRAGGHRHHARPAGERAQRGAPDLRHGRDHAAHSGPGREPLPDRVLPQTQAERPGHGLRRVRGTAPAGRSHPVAAGELRRRPPGPAALGMALQVRQARHRRSRCGATPATTATGTTPPRPASSKPSGSPGTWCRPWASRPPAAGELRGWQPRPNSAASTPWPSPRSCSLRSARSPDVSRGHGRRDRRLPRGRGGPGGVHLHQGHRAAGLVRPGHPDFPGGPAGVLRGRLLRPGGRPDQDAAAQRRLLLPGPARTAPAAGPD